MSYCMPADKCVVVRELSAWLRGRASWKGDQHTSCVQLAETALYASETMWNEDFAALEKQRSACCCTQADCVCASPR